jgi:hypothetical protein
MNRRKNLARPTEGVSKAGSGVPGGTGGSNGHPTAMPDSLGAPDTVVDDSGPVEVGSGGSGDLGDLTVLPADDPTLGLTNYGDRPPEDWAANTGPTRTAEGSKKAVSRELVDESETVSGRKIDFDQDKDKREKERPEQNRK